ncbi:cupin domain-containing protein [Streptomyces sp. NBC_00691]|uniref:cupin domain-containing protein n=1 Tax=Streptomyces sp. NBC_00691 TaxID=2903671 RepID=UPI002E2FC1FC|nr:cupin domain-containing protein [Streptomyces sp. NBC_00691]
MTAEVHEHPYFPAPGVTQHDDGIRVESYRRENTEVRLLYIAPGATVRGAESRQEAHVGMVIRGEISATVGDVTQLMKPEHDVYVAPPGVELSAVNTSSTETILLEIRRCEAGETYSAPSGYFLEPLESRKFVKMDVTFFLADWIELMIADIPGGGEMPYHKHSHEQIGTCLDGRYEMTVEGARHELRFGATYFCGSQEGHGAANPNEALARSLNIFIPPRYHRVPQQEAEQESR